MTRAWINISESLSYPLDYFGWSQDLFGNPVLIGKPSPCFRYPATGIGAGAWRSTWFVHGEHVHLAEFFSSWEVGGSRDTDVRTRAFLASCEADVVESSPTQSICKMITVFHKHAEPTFLSQVIHSFSDVLEPAPRRSSLEQGVTSVDSPGLDVFRSHDESAAHSKEIDVGTEAGLCQESLVLGHQEIAQEACRCLQSQAAGGCSEFPGGLATAAQDSLAEVFNSGAKSAGEQVLASSGDDCFGGQSTRNLEAMPELQDKVGVHSLWRGESSSSSPQEERLYDNLCGKGGNHAGSQQDQEGVKQLISAVRKGDGANHDESKCSVVAGLLASDGSCHDSIDPRSAASTDGLACSGDSVSADAGASSPIESTSCGGVCHQFRRRGDERLHQLWWSIQGRTLSAASFWEALGVSPCTDQGLHPISDWFVSGCGVGSHDRFLKSDSVLCQLRGEQFWFSFVLWKDQQLAKDLTFSDMDDDREFQLTRRHKKAIRNNAESFLARAVFHKEFEDEVQTATGRDGRTLEPTGPCSRAIGPPLRTATGRDGRTLEPTGPSSRAQEVTGRDGSTLEPTGPGSRAEEPISEDSGDHQALTSLVEPFRQCSKFGYGPSYSP